MRKYYVYHHYRKDTGEIFYVGVGCYGRLRTKKGRNKYWHEIVDEVGFYSKIIVKNLTKQEAYFIEKLEIKKYGRKDLGLGTLVNLTDGGGGIDNLSPEVKEKLSNIGKTLVGEKNPFYGKTHTEEVIEIIRQSQLGEKSRLYGKPQTEKLKEGIRNGKNKGHKRVVGEKNPKVKLTKEDVLYIFHNHIKGEGTNNVGNTKELCEMFGVDKSCILNISNKKSWKDLLKDERKVPQ